jgi:hypothetical protein
MHLAVVGVRVREVLLHVLGQQVAAVAGGVDQHVGRGRRDRAVEDGLQRLVAGLALLEAQVVAEHHELLGPAGDHVDDVGQVGEVGLVHLDQPQAAVAYSFRQALISDDLPVPRAPVSSTLLAGWPARTARCCAGCAPSAARSPSGRPGGCRHVPHRLQRAVAAGPLAVAPGDGVVPLGRRAAAAGRPRCDRAVHGALDQGVETIRHER